jgi:hypothetical protein
VVDALQKTVGRSLELSHAVERFDLAHKAALGRQHRALAAQIGRIPTQHIGEQPRHLVVEVVAGGQGGKAVFIGERLK